MPSEVTVKRAFLTRTLTVDYLVNAAITAANVPELYCACFDLLPRKQAQLVQDTKGIDSGAVIHPQLTPAPQAGREELLWVKGQIDPDLKGGRDYHTDFSALVCSAFSEFSGSHHINYTISEERDRGLPDYVPLLQLGRIIPLQVEAFRLGLEFFGSSYITAMMGYVPEVVETMILEVTTSQLALHTYSEGLSAKTVDPLKHGQIFERLNGALSSIVGFDLLADFRAKVSAAL
ncbi:MAG: hypothetical protein K1X83_00775 [Oligoflexia bacterium]|nr:hypothetical protein [Oligoflexia bacterium]